MLLLHRVLICACTIISLRSIPFRVDKYVVLLYLYHHGNSHTEEYRSGHNEPHSKCGDGQPSVGSNPTSSAKIAISLVIAALTKAHENTIHDSYTIIH